MPFCSDLRDSAQDNVPANLFDLFSAMQACPFRFHLTGSRFHGAPTQDSDWDVFTADWPKCRELLEEWGFLEVGRCYFDSTIGAIYYSRALFVHVQLIDPAKIDEKLRARDMLQAMGIWCPDPEVMGEIWEETLTAENNYIRLSSLKAITLFVEAGHCACFELPSPHVPTELVPFGRRYLNPDDPRNQDNPDDSCIPLNRNDPDSA